MRVQKVLRVQRVQRVQRVVVAASRQYNAAFGGSENHATGPMARGNAPLSPPAAVLPPKGEVCPMLPLELT